MRPMSSRSRRLSVVAGVAALASCTGDANLGRRPSTEPLSRPTLDAGAAAATMEPKLPDAAVSGAAGAAVTASALRLELHSPALGPSDIELRCPDMCFKVELAASGGVPPYQYAWADGATDASRTLCPTSDTPLRAEVRDALGSVQSAVLPVRRVPCEVGQLCAANLSFDGSPTLGAQWLTANGLDSASWDDCRTTSVSTASTQPRIVNAASGDEFPTASDGSTYLYLPARSSAHASVGQALCAGLERGSVYYLRLDLAYAAEDRTGAPLQPGMLELYASGDTCHGDTLLWTSPALHTGFRTYCVALQPTTRATALVLSATAPAGADAAVFVDHLVAASGCP